MSAQNIITAMEKLVKLHKSLYDLAEKKTQIIKTGDMDALNKIMIDEQKHVKAIGMIEREREQSVLEFLQRNNSAELVPNLSSCIGLAEDSEKETLNDLKQSLVESVLKLKVANYLNQQLIYQSLQFINLSLDMVRPSPKAFNYEKPVQQKGQYQAGNRSYFNSKA
ncbi:flagellar biosynthesis/type III secretory pathway chaperone [Peribacillus deserti]|uniref:Flagellar biosynthesis/type III secretory pathway chaperone n=1 Tax=Peribacillus deserti TaxID=673318 RepID=A0ABS2QDJ4_9BACI|nr:flagellar protein FlgN [Peribacillus deserti]MBM7690884.1 flagellar biosynthesis/type III secretory pathway chaperone [Peribacillus deserti]